MPDETATGSSRGSDGEATSYNPSANRPPGTPEYIASFRILRLIGAGGMGAVYEAEQGMPQRIVALKVIRPGLASEELLHRFEQEMQIMARLQHPGIAQIYQAGKAELGGGLQPYFAMELVVGEPLLNYASARKLGTRERLRLVATVCEAVQHAHQRGIIHRDLKPGNILVSRDSGQPKILDFGIARATNCDVQATAYTQMGQLVGTIPYMSPEQVAGDPNDLDTRSDVYALGVILYELLAGRLPHDVTRKSAYDAVRAIREEEPARLSSISKQFRGDIETIVAKALEKDKRRRYGSAADLAADIYRFLDDQPIIARPPSGVYQLKKFARRNKALVAGVLSALVILIVGVIVSTREAIRATRAERLAGTRLVEAEQARSLAEKREAEAESARTLATQRQIEAEANFRRAEEARLRAERQEEANRELLYVSDMNLAQQVWDAGNQPRLLELLSRYRPQAGKRDLRGFEWYHLWKLSHLYRFSLKHPSYLAAMDLSRDGREILSGDAAGNLRVWDVATGRELLALKNTQPPTSVSFSPDGKVLAILDRSGTIRVVNRHDARDLATLSLGNSSSGVGLKFASGGRLLLAGSRPIKCWDLSTFREIFSRDEPTWPLSTARDRFVSFRAQQKELVIWGNSSEVPLKHDDPIRDIAIGDGGARIASLTEKGLVTLWDTTTGRQVVTLQTQASAGSRVRFSASGSRLLVTLTRGAAIFDLATGKEIATVQVPTLVRDGLFSPDESLLAVVASDGVTLYDLFPPNSWPPRRGRVKALLKGHNGAPLQVSFTPDGRVLVTRGSESVKVWELSRLNAVEVFDGHKGQVSSVDVSPDGRWLASSGFEDSSVKLWDMHSGLEARSLSHRARLRWVALAGDHNRLVTADVEGSLSVWDVSRGVVLRSFKAHDQPIRAMSCSTDGRRIAVAAGNSVEIWNVADGRLLRSLPHRRAYAVAFSPSGRKLASGGFDGALRLWTLPDGIQSLELRRQPAGIYSLAYSADGKRIASGDESGQVALWDALKGHLIVRFRAHPLRVMTLAFSPDGRRLLSGAREDVLRLWDVTTRGEVGNLKQTVEWVNSARFTPDGSAIVAGTARGPLWIWRADRGYLTKD